MFWKNQPEIQSTRHYYSNDQLFEKSLDIYRPVNDEKRMIDPEAPVVLLVVGSGWVGHRAFVYAQTSWWNSSGPKTVVKSTGAPCVCIRHRGAFCVLPSVSVILQCLVALLGILRAVTQSWELAIGVTSLVAIVLSLLAVGGRGSADLEDMWDDVTEALVWIENHRDLLGSTTTSTLSSVSKKELVRQLSSTSDVSENSCHSDDSPPTPLSAPEDFRLSGDADEWIPITNNNNNNIPPLVFGGYSSGGHVAATLLQQPERFTRHGLPEPKDLFQGILMISSMMAVRPEHVTVTDIKDNTAVTLTTPLGAPTWLTDFVVRAVWGQQRMKEIPSPLVVSKTRQPPALPHLLLGCRNEVFGLNWLDVFFCSQAFATMVQTVTGQPAKYVELESDHWFVLNSKELKDALQEELPKLLVQQCNNNNDKK